MTLKTTLDILNDKIDQLIIKGQTNTKEYKRLIKLHLNIVSK